MSSFPTLSFSVSVDPDCRRLVSHHFFARDHRQLPFDSDLLSTKTAHSLVRLLSSSLGDLRYDRTRDHVSSVFLQTVRCRSSSQFEFSLWFTFLLDEDLRRIDALATRLRGVQSFVLVALSAQRSMLSNGPSSALEYLCSSSHSRGNQFTSAVWPWRRLLPITALCLGLRSIDEISHLSVFLSEYQSDH